MVKKEKKQEEKTEKSAIDKSIPYTTRQRLSQEANKNGNV